MVVKFLWWPLLDTHELKAHEKPHSKPILFNRWDSLPIFQIYISKLPLPLSQHPLTYIWKWGLQNTVQIQLKTLFLLLISKHNPPAPKFCLRAISLSHWNCVNLYVYNFVCACFIFFSLPTLVFPPHRIEYPLSSFTIHHILNLKCNLRYLFSHSIHISWIFSIYVNHSQALN